MESIRKIFAKKENIESNIAIKMEINQSGSGKLKISEPPRKKLGDEIVLPTRKINPMEKGSMERKKMQELQNKIMEHRNNLALTKGVVPDPRKRQFIKKGIMGIIAGIGIAVFSKMTRGIQNVNFNDGTTAFDLQDVQGVIRPNQPAFLALNSAQDDNVTGNGGTATVDFDSEVFDQNGDFASDTFTAPVTGRYLFIANIVLEGLTTSVATIPFILNTSNSSPNIHFTSGHPDGVGGNWQFNIVAFFDMDANDTSTISLAVTGLGDNTVDIFGGSNDRRTSFSVCLLT